MAEYKHHNKPWNTIFKGGDSSVTEHSSASEKGIYIIKSVI
jgi:predicted Zn-dependent protease